MITQTQGWRCKGSRRLKYVMWDDEYVVFDRLSGSTYAFDRLTFQILASISEAAPDIELQHISGAELEGMPVVDYDGFASEILEARLELLESLNLIEPQA